MRSDHKILQPKLLRKSYFLSSDTTLPALLSYSDHFPFLTPGVGELCDHIMCYIYMFITSKSFIGNIWLFSLVLCFKISFILQVVTG